MSFNLFTISFLSRDKIMSYIPGPNLDPVRAILNGCPTPLKFILCLFINRFIIFSKLSLLIFDVFSYSFEKSFKIFFEGLSKSFKSSGEI